MKRALVVGGANGIGLSIATELAKREDIEKVYIVDKAAIAEELEHNDTLSPLETASSIFPDQPALQQAYQEELRKKGFEDNQAVKIEKEPIVKKIINHKLKTDTGIELSIPVEYFDSTVFLEFQKTENGTMTITLKNISNIMNRIS